MLHREQAQKYTVYKPFHKYTKVIPFTNSGTGYMSPMTSPHLANDSLDPASDDEDIPNYHNEIRTLGKYISNTLQDPRRLFLQFCLYVIN